MLSSGTTIAGVAGKTLLVTNSGLVLIELPSLKLQLHSKVVGLRDISYRTEKYYCSVAIYSTLL